MNSTLIKLNRKREPKKLTVNFVRETLMSENILTVARPKGLVLSCTDTEHFFFPFVSF